MKPYYSEAGITIYHGDCREVVGALCCQPDLVLADPPYGVPSLQHGGGGFSANRMRNASRKMYARTNEPVTGNSQPFDPSPWLSYPKVILWGANHYADRLPPSKAWIAWDKREGQTSDYNADAELAWTNTRNQLRLYSQLWRGMCIRGEENGKRRLHPTQKPVALMRECIKYARLSPNSLILDPFMGSGTVLVAAYREGHRAIGVEIEERYCEIAAKRLAQGVLDLYPTEASA